MSKDMSIQKVKGTFQECLKDYTNVKGMKRQDKDGGQSDARGVGDRGSKPRPVSRAPGRDQRALTQPQLIR
jgi:hypothetical protein